MANGVARAFWAEIFAGLEPLDPRRQRVKRRRLRTRKRARKETR